ncbi:MAG TPA: ABC transporter permease [Myxococcales bacterium]|jgi:lipoprotein-releasing system permease protein
MPFEWFLAIRFLREGRAQTGLILGGVAVGVGVIIFLSALISGLQDTLVRQTLGSQAHIVVRPPEETARQVSDSGEAAVALRREKAPARVQSLGQWQQVLENILQTEDVVAAAATVNGSAFASRGIATKAVSLRGVDPDAYDRIINIRPKMKAGVYRLAGGEAVIGSELAKDLGLALGDKLRLATVSDRGEDRGDVFTVAGVFDLGNKDVNQRWVFVPMKSAQSLLDLPGAVSTIEVRVREYFGADEVARAIAARTGMVADSWTVLNKSLLIGLRSQNASSYMIQLFVIIAVALGIASVLVVSVVQKSKEIGILKAVGTTTGQIKRIFLIQGAIVGLFGSAAGSGLGAVLSLLFASMAKNPDGSPTFPVDLNPTLFATAALVATVTGLISAVAPAARAAKLDPAEAIHG